jgi:hypothetical protein
LPKSADRLKAEVSSAHGLLFVTRQPHRSVPIVLTGAPLPVDAPGVIERVTAVVEQGITTSLSTRSSRRISTGRSPGRCRNPRDEEPRTQLWSAEGRIGSQTSHLASSVGHSELRVARSSNSSSAAAGKVEDVGREQTSVRNGLLIGSTGPSRLLLMTAASDLPHNSAGIPRDRCYAADPLDFIPDLVESAPRRRQRWTRLSQRRVGRARASDSPNGSANKPGPGREYSTIGKHDGSDISWRRGCCRTPGSSCAGVRVVFVSIRRRQFPRLCSIVSAAWFPVPRA